MQVSPQLLSYNNVARAKELNAEMETALIGTLEAERGGKVGGG
jgi:hypothetical protein